MRRVIWGQACVIAYLLEGQEGCLYRLEETKRVSFCHRYAI